MIMHFGNVMLYPRLMYRDNLVGANPFVAPSITPDGTLNPGLSPRDRDNDPFAVLGNREARSAEMFLTWDPSGATPFYDWDNDWREDAKFAFNVGGNYTEYPTPTDAYLFFFEPSGINASFGRGLPAEEIWSVTSRLVFNPTQRSRFIARLVRGFEQSTGDPDGGARDFFEIHGKAVLGRRHIISGYFMKDSWGPYDFYRQFNITYPEQYRIDYSYLLGSAGKLGSRVDEERASKIGIRATFRTTDENSPDDEFLGGLNDHLFLVVAYFTYRF
jgi:beta-galactosidase